GQDQLFGGRGNDVLRGGKGKDELNGGPGHDRLNGGHGGDLLTGAGGRDRFYLKRHGHSLLSNYDTITDLEIGKDRIKGRYPVSAQDLPQLGTIDDLQPQTIRTVLTRSVFQVKGAAIFTTVDGDTFLALNNKAPGFQAKTDAIVNITGFSGDLANLRIF
ncbi:bluetail domain-containing putative surface protein, partial [Okeania sp. SIO2G5]|uniref:bluetail domain-containing putative surface protein n=1 Tax=Okeania sp. SIO2G5 TaxID=2607796 RepID=UPI0013C1CD2F